MKVTKEVEARAALVRKFFGQVRRIDETLEQWQARVNADEFKADHKELWNQGVCI